MVAQVSLNTRGHGWHMEKTTMPNKLNHKPQPHARECKENEEIKEKNNCQIKYFAVKGLILEACTRTVTLSIDLFWKPVQEQWHYRLTSIDSVTVLVQASKINPLTAKYFIWQLFFSLISSFSLHSLAWGCGLWFNLFGIVVFSICQPCPLVFSETWATIYFMQTLQVQQFLDLSCYITLLHSVLYTAE